MQPSTHLSSKDVSDVDTKQRLETDLAEAIRTRQFLQASGIKAELDKFAEAEFNFSYKCNLSRIFAHCGFFVEVKLFDIVFFFWVVGYLPRWCDIGSANHTYAKSGSFQIGQETNLRDCFG